MTTSLKTLKIQYTEGAINGEWEIVALVGPHAGKVINARKTERDAIACAEFIERTTDVRTGKPRRDPVAQAWRHGAAHGVNGQIWDNA